jgi:hypothetical protein
LKLLVSGLVTVAVSVSLDVTAQLFLGFKLLAPLRTQPHIQTFVGVWCPHTDDHH